jgi:hypothetical protein
MAERSWIALCLAGMVVALPAQAKAPVGRFALQDGGKTVRDDLTGRVWQAVTDAAVTRSQDKAATWCQDNLQGLPGQGWRLPKLAELQTLVDRAHSSPSLDPIAFAAEVQQWAQVFAGTTWYWTASSKAGAVGAAWYVNFGYGDSGPANVGSALRVRCVRGGL